jgi:hypothetical protein
MSKSLTQKQALAIGQERAGKVYRVVPGTYGYGYSDIDSQNRYWAAKSQGTYQRALQYRAESVAREALIAMGHTYDDASFMVANAQHSIRMSRTTGAAAIIRRAIQADRA